MNKYRNKDASKNEETKKLIVKNEKKVIIIIQFRHPLSKRLVNQRCILLY